MGINVEELDDSAIAVLLYALDYYQDFNDEDTYSSDFIFSFAELYRSVEREYQKRKLDWRMFQDG